LASPATARAGAATPAQIAATAQALRQGGQDALARQHQLARQQEQLERELAPLLAERERSTSARARVSTVQVTLAAPQGGELRLSYAVRGPGWQPATAPRWTAPRKSCSSGAPGAGGAKHGRGLGRRGHHPVHRPARRRHAGAAAAALARGRAAPGRGRAGPGHGRAGRRAMAAPAAKSAAEADADSRASTSACSRALCHRICRAPARHGALQRRAVTLALGEQALDTELLVRATPALDATPT
jgi:hypothetical protein